MTRLYIILISLLLTPYALCAATPIPKLTVYTNKTFASGWEQQNPNHKKLFESQCNCIIELKVFEKSSAILSRLMLEGKNSPADLVVGIDSCLADKVENLNILTTHNIDATHLTIPVKWSNKYLIPYDYRYLAFIYDQNKLNNPPKSFEDIANNPELTILIQDPRSSSIGFGLVAWINMLYQDQASEMWKKLRHNIEVTKNWRDGYELFMQGKADLLFSYNISPIYGANIKASEFKQGHYLQLELAGKLKSSRHPELADQFLRFILSPTVQTTVSMTSHTLPVVNIDQKLPKLYEAFFTPEKIFIATPTQIRNNRNLWIKTWLKALEIQ